MPVEAQMLAPVGEVLTDAQIRMVLESGLAGRLTGARVLALIPDHTRTLPLPLLFRIVTDLLKNGYDGGFSMEPHMKNVFHESVGSDQRAQEKFDNYVEYGRRFMQLVENIKK